MNQPVHSLPRPSLALLVLALSAASCIAPAKVESKETATPTAAAASTAIPPQPGATLEPLFDELDKLDTAPWKPTDHSANGPIFHCGWRTDNVIFAGCKLASNVDNAVCPETCVGRAYAA